MEKDNLFEEFVKDRNLSKNTHESYLSTLKKYTTYTNQTLTELIQEADNEEEQGIRMKKRQITKKLKNFRAWLIQQNYSKSTIIGDMSHINTIYNHFEIEIPKLPRVQIKKQYHESYEDIPRIEHVKEALESTSNLMYRAMILFMVSSGSARNETLSLTVHDFIKATSDYHNSNDIEEVIETLEKQVDIIPLWQLTRFKTDYQYYTCSSPESTRAFIKWLKKMDIKSNNDKIFNIIPKSVNEFFRRLNRKNNWKIKKNGVYFFQPHALRKLNATVIEDKGFANTIQGRKADSVSDAYFKHNPKRIKEKYLEHLPKLTINKTIVNKIDDEATKELRKENEQIRKEFSKERENNDLLAEKIKILEQHILDPSIIEKLKKVDHEN